MRWSGKTQTNFFFANPVLKDSWRKKWLVPPEQVWVFPRVWKSGPEPGRERADPRCVRFCLPVTRKNCRAQLRGGPPSGTRAHCSPIHDDGCLPSPCLSMQKCPRYSSIGKESTCNSGDPAFNSWVRKIPWRRKWQPTPVFLPGESQGQRSLAGYSPWDRKSQTQLGD